MNLAANTVPRPGTLPSSVEETLAEHGFYRLQIALLLQSPRVLKALQHFDQVRRNVHAMMNAEVMTMLGQINQAQQQLAAVIEETLAPYPTLQGKVRQMAVQLALIDGLSACVLL